MAQNFSYKAIDKKGAQVVGALTAENRQSAFEQLSSRGLSPFELKQKKLQSQALFARKTITKKDLLRYVRQLATLLSANVGILDTLTTLAQSSAHPILSQRTKALKRDLRAGHRFAAALETHFAELPSYVRRLAELGEATGALSKALSDAADRMEYEETMRSEIRSALTYPTFLAVIGTLIIILLFYFVVPRFATLLGDNISNAPALSRVVINAGVWLKANLFMSLSALVGGVAFIVILLRQKGLADAARNQLERVPIIGQFIRQAEIAAWSRTVGVALANKAQLTDALQLGEAATRSPNFRLSLEQVRRDIRAGRPLDEALQDATDNIDPVVIDLIRTGRSAGVLDEMMLFAADMLEKEAKERAKKFTALTEPLAILGISLIVGVIIVAIVMAMTSLYQFDI